MNARDERDACTLRLTLQACLQHAICMLKACQTHAKSMLKGPALGHPALLGGPLLGLEAAKREAAREVPPGFGGAQTAQRGAPGGYPQALSAAF